MARKKNNSGKWIAAGVVVCAAVIGMSFLQLGESVVYFYTPDEAIAKAADISQNTIKVGGLVKPESVSWEARDLALDFTLTDNAGHEIFVKHTGTPPDMFKEGQGVVVEGRLSEDGSTIVSRTLLVKHSEEYTKPENADSIDTKLLEQSMFNN